MKYIYGLVDPRDRQIKYVGQSNDPERRFHEHVTLTEATSKGVWIQELRTLDKAPEFILIDECADEEAFYLENWWILVGRRQGWPLTNGTKPGEWRAQEDFNQLFDERLRAIEAEHRRAIDRMDTDAIKSARRMERLAWENKMYLFPYLILTVCSVFNSYGSIVKALATHAAALDLLIMLMLWLVFASYSFLHFTLRKENSIRLSFEVSFWVVFLSVLMQSIYFVYEMGVMSR